MDMKQNVVGRRIFLLLIGMIYPVALLLGYTSFLDQIEPYILIVVTISPMLLSGYEIGCQKKGNAAALKEIYRIKLFYFGLYLLLILLDNLLSIKLTYYLYGLSVLIASDRISSTLIKYWALR